ncbi:MAG: O-methyltransferase [Phycisphaeraceae bacterium]|nr:MAG: O-methyltransferase [Phycisphaeraceae bacterium]
MDGAAELWRAVDDVCERMAGALPRGVEVAARRCAELGLPEINVTPSMGRLLEILARLTGAARVLEIGTLGGYSTAWLAEGLAPGGRVVTVEVDPARAASAEETFRLGGIGGRVSVRCGRGLEVIGALESEGAGPFDLVFIDADKENSGAYFQRALGLTRPGGVIIVDNVVRGGAIADTAGHDPRVRGSLDAIERMGASAGVLASVLQTVGSKGYDGFAIAWVGGPAR